LRGGGKKAQNMIGKRAGKRVVDTVYTFLLYFPPKLQQICRKIAKKLKFVPKIQDIWKKRADH